MTRKGETTLGALTETRHQRILERLLQDRGVKATSIADELGVSTETIRRDLRQLEKEGRLKRVYGGAVPFGRDIPPLQERMQRDVAAKEAMAKIVPALVEEDQWIYLGGGSPLIPVARRLADGPRLKVMTHMPAVADALIGTAEHEVHLTGGQYNAKHRFLQGQRVFDSIEGRRFDLAIVGAQALHAQYGMVDVVEFLSRLKRQLLSASKRCIWICDASGFNQEAHFQTAAFNEIDTLITDERPAGALMNALEEADVQLLVASEINVKSGQGRWSPPVSGKSRGRQKLA